LKLIDTYCCVSYNVTAQNNVMSVMETRIIIPGRRSSQRVMICDEQQSCDTISNTACFHQSASSSCDRVNSAVSLTAHRQQCVMDFGRH